MKFRSPLFLMFVALALLTGVACGGSDGVDGPPGVDGIDGADGPRGPAGATGPEGDRGLQGPQGPPGATGAPGEDGEAGEDGRSTRVEVTDLDVGDEDCPWGGVRIDVYAEGQGGDDGDELVATHHVCNGAPGPDGPDGPTGPPGPVGEPGEAGETPCTGRAPLEVASVSGFDQTFYRGFASAPLRVETNVEVGDEARLSLAFVASGLSFADLGEGEFSVTPSQVGGPFEFAFIVTDGCTTAIGQGEVLVAQSQTRVRFVHVADGAPSMNVRMDDLSTNTVTNLLPMSVRHVTVESGERRFRVLQGSTELAEFDAVTLPIDGRVMVVIASDDEGELAMIALEEDTSPLADAEEAVADRTLLRVFAMHAAGGAGPADIVLDGVELATGAEFGAITSPVETAAADVSELQVTVGGEVERFRPLPATFSAGDDVAFIVTMRDGEPTLAAVFLEDPGTRIDVVSPERPGRVQSPADLGLAVPQAEFAVPQGSVFHTLDVAECGFPGEVDVTLTIDKVNRGMDLDIWLWRGGVRAQLPTTAGSAGGSSAAFGTRTWTLGSSSEVYDLPADGAWTIEVTDTSDGTPATLQSWALDIECIEEQTTALVYFIHLFDGLGSSTFRNQSGGTSRTVTYSNVGIPIRVDADEQETMEVVAASATHTIPIDVSPGDHIAIALVPDADGDPSFIVFPADHFLLPADAGSASAELARLQVVHGFAAAGDATVDLGSVRLATDVGFGDVSSETEASVLGTLLDVDVDGLATAFTLSRLVGASQWATLFVVPTENGDMQVLRWSNTERRARPLIEPGALVPLPEAFDADEGTLPAGWVGGGIEPFSIVVDSEAPGGRAARSGLTTLDDNEVSWMEMTFEAEEAGALTWNWKASSEECCDFLFVCINRATCGRVSGQSDARVAGNVDWTEHSIALAPGIYKVRWGYGKDPSVHDGDDAGWVTNVRFVPED